MDFFKNMTTKKMIIIAIVAVIGLNYISDASQKNFDKSVLKSIQRNNVLARQAFTGQLPENFELTETAKNPEPAPAPEAAAPAPAPQEQPNPEEEFKKQLADKVTVDIGNTPIKGNANAKIMIVVFSDFQCPFSKRGADTVMALMDKYGNNINFVHKNLPLGFHSEALPAAKACLAAGKQGKFYEFHDKLYENQESLSAETYTKIATELGLNIDKFNKDRESQEIADQIKADQEQATKLGFNGTPGFTLNGVKILGAYPIDHFEKIITALGLN